MEIPKGQIKWLVGRLHVGTPDAEIEADMRRRATGGAWTPELVERAVDYALRCHEDNRAIYRMVQRGI